MFFGEEIESECPLCGYINLVEVDESTDNWTDCEMCCETYPATDSL